ncbi:MAG: aspartate racemase [Halieaceae bacterium]|jgi:aspartate racemase
MAENMRKTIGVIAGMGPLTTVDFLSRLIAATPGSKDQDHIRVLIDHNPTIPNRQESIAGTGPDVTADLKAMAQGLETAGADFLVMSCNTAHAYQRPIQEAVNIPFISIIDTAVEYLHEHHAGQVVGVVATEGCLRANLYQQGLANVGLEALVPGDRQLAKLMDAIFEIKAGDTGREITSIVESVVNDLIFSGAEVILSACTELPLVLDENSVSVPLVDPTHLLVSRCAELASGQRPLPITRQI